MIDRRTLMGNFGTAAIAGSTFCLARTSEAVEAQYAAATKGLPSLKITKVKAILTRPRTARLVVVKAETSEPGLFGLGCATFNQQA